MKLITFLSAATLLSTVAISTQAQTFMHPGLDTMPWCGNVIPPYFWAPYSSTSMPGDTPTQTAARTPTYPPKPAHFPELKLTPEKMEKVKAFLEGLSEADNAHLYILHNDSGIHYAQMAADVKLSADLCHARTLNNDFYKGIYTVSKIPYGNGELSKQKMLDTHYTNFLKQADAQCKNATSKVSYAEKKGDECQSNKLVCPSAKDAKNEAITAVSWCVSAYKDIYNPAYSVPNEGTAIKLLELNNIL